ncbi:MAG: hypothetical protein F6K11_20560 [Leptolyngbya sp. SIO3F4]|nr:hypothetical protein [Leptolyngbya sp. SIO3F4]
MQTVNSRINESTGNIPAIFEALTNSYFYNKQDAKIGSKSPITTFDVTNETNTVRQVQVNPVRIIAVGDESGQVFIYRSKDDKINELINSFNLKSKINCIQFNAQSDALLIGTQGGEVYLLRDFTQRKSSVKLLRGQTGNPIISVNFFSPAESNQLYCLTANENKLTLWEISETKGRQVLHNIFETKANSIKAVDVSQPIANNTLIAVASGELTNIYKVVNSKRGIPQLQQNLSIKTNYNIRKISATSVSAVAFSKDGKRLATAYANGNIETWETKQFSQLNSYFGHTGAVHTLTFSHDGERLVSGGDDQTLRIWDKLAIEEPLILRNENNVYAISGTDNLKEVISLRDNHFLRFWPTQINRLVEDLCDNTPSSELLPLQEVYEYAGTSFTYKEKNCVNR